MLRKLISARYWAPVAPGPTRAGLRDLSREGKKMGVR